MFVHECKCLLQNRFLLALWGIDLLPRLVVSFIKLLSHFGHRYMCISDLLSSGRIIKLILIAFRAALAAFDRGVVNLI